MRRPRFGTGPRNPNYLISPGSRFRVPPDSDVKLELGPFALPCQFEPEWGFPSDRCLRLGAAGTVDSEALSTDLLSDMQARLVGGYAPKYVSVDSCKAGQCNC